MGIIKAGMGAVRGAAADQWKEIFCAEEMDSELLIKQGKRMVGERGGNEGSSEVITDGSLIIVREGECAIATEGGKVIGVYAEPGEQIFSSDQSKGIFSGSLGAVVKDIGRRFTFGGDVAVTQKIYYVNTKELTGGTIRGEGIPVRFKDLRAGVDIDGGVTCYGSYTFRITDPERYYKAVIHSSDGRSRRQLLKQMDSEVLTALGPALERMTREGVRPSELMQHPEALCAQLREEMKDKWSGLRGIEVYSVALESLEVLDAQMMKTMQRDTAFMDPTRAAAHLTGARGDAMQAAAANEGGGAVVIAAALSMGAAPMGSWRCSCGVENMGKFCTECGAKKPVALQCGHCGWVPEDGAHPPKFCMECGKPFGR